MGVKSDTADLALALREDAVIVTLGLRTHTFGKHHGQAVISRFNDELSILAGEHTAMLHSLRLELGLLPSFGAHAAKRRTG